MSWSYGWGSAVWLGVFLFSREMACLCSFIMFYNFFFSLLCSVPVAYVEFSLLIDTLVCVGKQQFSYRDS